MKKKSSKSPKIVFMLRNFLWYLYTVPAAILHCSTKNYIRKLSFPHSSHYPPNTPLYPHPAQPKSTLPVPSPAFSILVHSLISLSQTVCLTEDCGGVLVELFTSCMYSAWNRNTSLSYNLTRDARFLVLMKLEWCSASDWCQHLSLLETPVFWIRSSGDSELDCLNP
jgi:hypothetical protein